MQLDSDAEGLYRSMHVLILCANKYMKAGEHKDIEERLLRKAIASCRDAIDRYDATDQRNA